MGLILGADGKVHAGEVERKFSGTRMACDCGAEPMRPIGSELEAAKLGVERMCPDCWGEVPQEVTLERLGVALELNEGTGFAMPGKST